MKTSNVRASQFDETTGLTDKSGSFAKASVHSFLVGGKANDHCCLASFELKGGWYGTV